MPMCFDVLAQGAGICVALETTDHLATVRLVHVVCASVLEAIAGVGVAFAAAFIRADVGFFPWNKQESASWVTGVNVVNYLTQESATINPKRAFWADFPLIPLLCVLNLCIQTLLVQCFILDDTKNW